MPNVLTHGLMAHQVVQKLDFNQVSAAIEAYPGPFFFGSNGPDVLFYHNRLPHLRNPEIDWIRDLGSQIHREKINEFYLAGLEYYQLKRDHHELFLSFLAGHLCHWSLDSIAHPYVFAKTGLLEGDSEHYHIRFESMVDALMVEKVLLKPLSEFPTYKFVKLTAKERRVLALGYQYMIKKTFDIYVPLKDLDLCMKTMYQILHLLFDKTSLRFHAMNWIETKLWNDPYRFSKHVVHPDLDTTRDILNLAHKPWRHPAHPEQEFTSSFVDLYHQAIQRGTYALNLLNQVLNTKGEVLAEFIDHRDYEMGTNDGIPPTIFDLIYP